MVSDTLAPRRMTNRNIRVRIMASCGNVTFCVKICHIFPRNTYFGYFSSPYYESRLKFMPYFIILTCYQINDTNRTLIYSGTPLIRSPMGQKKLAVLTGDCINEGQKKSGCKNVITYYRGRSKVGYHGRNKH